MHKQGSAKGPPQIVDAQRYEALVQHIRDYAILMLDVDGYVISWNEGAQAIHGYAADEIIGQHFSKF